MEALDKVAERWKSLAPFFQLQGYYLYEWRGSFSVVPPQDIPSSRTFKDPATAYPYGWTPADMTLARDWDYAFNGTAGYRLWAARDDLGREVLIRLVSFPGEESQELKVYRRLNAPEARQDPRNHTLPVLDWLDYSGLTFVVLPRWGNTLVGGNCLRAEQVLRFGEIALETLAFLHEKRIAHRDIHLRNTVGNIMTGSCSMKKADTCKLNLAAERFALIDFDASILLPLDGDISQVVLKREYRIQTSCAGLGEGLLANPFEDDVFVLLFTLQSYTRVFEGDIPQIGVFFDDTSSFLPDQQQRF